MGRYLNIQNVQEMSNVEPGALEGGGGVGGTVTCNEGGNYFNAKHSINTSEYFLRKHLHNNLRKNI